jgi:hypothetical protein
MSRTIESSRARGVRSGPRPAAAGIALLVAAGFAACDTDARYTQITDPDTGAEHVVTASLDFTKTQSLPPDFASAGQGRIYVFGNEIRLDATNVARPPEGHYYSFFLANADTDTYLELGALTAPPPEYAPLRDADVQLLPGVVTEAMITRGVARQVQAVDFNLFTEFWLVLLPKAGGSSTPGIVAAAGDVPGVLQDD